MRVSGDAWLSGVLGLEVFRLDDAREIGAGERDALAEHIGRQARALYYAKVGTEAIADVAALSRLGFTVVDVNVTLAAPPSIVAAPASRGDSTEIATADAADRDAVLDIAGSCFRYSRFHIDPCIGLETAHHVKREWMASYFAGRRGDRLFVARRNGAVVGFLGALAAERDGRPAAVIDLVGVATTCQRSGVGRALVRAFAAHYASCDSLLVGTQVVNVPSIRMYEDLGFRTAHSSYVLHRHVKVPA